MKMIWDQRPRVALGLCFLKDHSESFQKGSAILIIPKDFSAFNSPGLPAIASLFRLTLSDSILDDFSKIASQSPL